MKPQLIHIDAIIRDTGLQVRSRMEPATVKDYVGRMRSGRQFPPIQLALVDGKYLLLDGWHRLAAVRELGEYQIEALVQPMTRTEAVWAAAEANLDHGLPLRPSDKLAVFRAYIKSGRHKDGSRFKPYRTIEQELHGSIPRATLARWMHKHYPKIARAMGDAKGSGTEKDARHEGSNDPAHFGQAQQALSDTVNLYRLLDDLSMRGELIKQAEEALVEMKKVEYVEQDF